MPARFIAAMIALAAFSAPGADADFRPATGPEATRLANYTNKDFWEGGHARSKAVVSIRPVIVYRLWDSRSPGNRRVAGKMGKYWTDFPLASIGQARAALAVCPGWNDMKHLTICELRELGSASRRAQGRASIAQSSRTRARGSLRAALSSSSSRIQ